MAAEECIWATQQQPHFNSVYWGKQHATAAVGTGTLQHFA